ncbi:DUF3108 domain-containing protein [Porticoccus sp. W117]|uniref:DUF3108 domain-containing protein n=1 Tax=Porticoccus sp. W117 TaxID=3054777 RepID=UPI0025978D22|nr:DUF3108 domain-containing protein [Porticoccus sp. W117]MDM3870080.1 DUF3108 domain-containing protein [Porticoccus sp. W117]
MLRAVTALIFLLLCGMVYSDTAANSPPLLEPFTANYGAKYKGMHLKAKRILEPLGNGQYRITSHAKHLFFGGIKESSEFSLQDGRIQPTSYQMKRKILGSGRTETAAFDWDNNLVTSTYKGDSNELALTGQELDWLGYQLQISLDLMAGKDELHYQIVRRGQIKDYYFQVVGEEKIDTPMGEINTVKLERVKDPNKRQTTFWMAPKYNYLLVKFHRVENDGDEYSLYLRDLEMTDTGQ